MDLKPDLVVNINMIYMRKIFLFVLVLLTATKNFGQNGPEKDLIKTMEQFRQSMIDGNKEQLEKMVSDKLSYGHSGGHVDDKKEFVDKLATGKSDFVTMDITNQTITLFGKTAVVRHELTAQTNDGGKPGQVHLLVLLVWQKEKGQWKLIARQAVKPG